MEKKNVDGKSTGSHKPHKFTAKLVTGSVLAGKKKKN